MIDSISIVIPSYNESQNINEVYRRTLGTINKMNIKKYELIFVENGSKDNSLELLKKINSEISEKIDNTIPIKKSKNGEIIANAIVTPEQVSIILEDGIGLTPEVPPLRTFFVERIIGEMKKSDNRLVENGEINEESVINCIINKNGSAIREIIIKNYREKNRIDEIINTATWSLTRMIENSSK